MSEKREDMEGSMMMRRGFSRCIWQLLPFLATFMVAIPGASHADSNLFYPYLAIPTGSWPEAVAIGDVNGDGRNDVVMVTSFYLDPGNDNRLFVFLQDESGRLKSPLKYLTDGDDSYHLKTIAIGDVNNDGKADVVVGTQTQSVQVFLQDSTGNLQQPITYPTVNATSIRIADLNNDGRLDVVGIGWGPTDVEVFLQNSGGSLDPPATYKVNYCCDEVEVGDVNNDGLTDIITMTAVGIGILTQNASGGFNPPVYYSTGRQGFSSGIAVGDVNGDGLLDVVITSHNNYSSVDEISVFLQDNTGGIQGPFVHPSYINPGAVVIGDVSHDGRNDVITLHGGWLKMGIYLQDVYGALSPQETYFLPYASRYNAQGVAVGDVNGDGFNDVVIADYNHGLLVYHQRPFEPNIDISPSYLDFGIVYTGNTIKRMLTISNLGRVDLVLNTITLLGEDTSEFSIQNDGCSNQTLGIDGTCTLEICFSSAQVGTKRPKLGIPSNDPDMPVRFVDVLGTASIEGTNSDLFFPQVRYSLVEMPEAVAIGDVNGDGRNDVVMTTSQATYPENKTHVYVYLQNTWGELESATSYPLDPIFPLTIGIGDVNGDGRNDVVIGCQALGQSYIGVFLQNESGTLDPMVTYPTNTAFSIKVSDLDQDGLLDVAGINWGYLDTGYDFDVNVFRQNPEGSLDAPITYTAAHGGRDELEVGDVDNDGLTDIIVMSGQDNAIPNFGVLLQRLTGGFEHATYYDSGISHTPHGIAVGDVNGDGLEDVVLSLNPEISRIAVFLQNGAGTLGPPISYHSWGMGPIVIADVNHDGLKDVIVGGIVSVHLQDGDGTLLPVERYYPALSNGNTQGIAVGDINGDGLNDVVAANLDGLAILYHKYDGPRFSVFPGSIFRFPILKAGSSADQQFTFTNEGRVDLLIGDMTITGINASEFSLLEDNCSGKTLAQSETCSLSVHFLPSSQIRKHAALVIVSNDPRSPLSISLEGNVGVHLLTPSGGEVLRSGDFYLVQWENPFIANKFKLRYSVDGGLNWKLIAEKIAGTSYLWGVPAPSGNRASCLIKVAGFNKKTKIGDDISDSTFSIEVVKLTSPNGGEVLKSGESFLVQWQTHQTIRPIKMISVFLSLDDGVTWKEIQESPFPNRPGDFSWIVPNVASESTKCKLKMVLKDRLGNVIGRDVSDGSFTIYP